MFICRWLFDLPTCSFSHLLIIKSSTMIWTFWLHGPECGNWNLISKILQVSTHCTKSLYSYQMCGIPLETVEQHNYLGMCLHHIMSWQPHIDFIFLHRNLRNCPSKLKEYTYKQLILSILDYRSPIWDSQQHKLIHKLEMV